MQLILWDIDDVLVDTTGRIRRGQQAALATLELSDLRRANDIWEHLYWYYSQSDADQIVLALLDELGETRPANTIAAAAETYWRYANGGPFAVLEGVIPALQWAQQLGVPMGVVSNGKHQFQMQKLNEAGLLPYFDAQLIEIRDATNDPKPNPSGILACILRAGSMGAHTVYVGNRLTDVIAANRAGSIALLVSSGDFDFKEPSPTLSCERAAAEITSTRDLRSALTNIAEGHRVEE